MLKNFRKNKYNKGVTLIELLVVIFIFVIISTITVWSYGKFNSPLSIRNLADDIALSVRKAQGYAIGVRRGANSFDYGYGVHFTANPSGSLYAGTSKSFILFEDIGNNKQYDNSTSSCGNPSSGNECLEVLSTKSANKISEIQVNGTLITQSSTVDVLFRRPNPEPTFCYKVGGSGLCSASPINNIIIKISSDTDATVYKTITISNNGQISVSSS